MPGSARRLSCWGRMPDLLRGRGRAKDARQRWFWSRLAARHAGAPVPGTCSRRQASCPCAEAGATEPVPAMGPGHRTMCPRAPLALNAAGLPRPHSPAPPLACAPGPPARAAAGRAERDRGAASPRAAAGETRPHAWDSTRARAGAGGSAAVSRAEVGAGAALEPARRGCGRAAATAPEPPCLGWHPRRREGAKFGPARALEGAAPLGPCSLRGRVTRRRGAALGQRRWAVPAVGRTRAPPRNHQGRAWGPGHRTAVGAARPCWADEPSGSR